MAHDSNRRLRNLALAFLASTLALVAASCGGVGTSRETARDQATATTCGRLSMCGKIGPGGTYPTDDNCTIMQKAFWDNAWPAGTCDGKIDVSNLNVCLSAISATDCAGLDFLLTLGKCGAMKVCGAASSPDGGP